MADDMRTARAVVRGPLHVFSEVSPELQAVTGRRMVGVPYCEVFTEDYHKKCAELYDWARRHREDVAFICTSPTGHRGVVTLTPLENDELAVTFEPVQARPRLVPLEGESGPPRRVPRVG